MATQHRPPRLTAALAGLAAAAALAQPLSGHGSALEVLSWASLDPEQPVAPQSLAVVPGEFAERTTRAPGGVPATELDSVTVEVEGSDHVAHAAGILAVEPRRLVILIPDVPAGTAHLVARRGETELADGQFTVRLVSPGLFSAASSGGGLAAASAIRVSTEDGSQFTEDVAYYNDERGAYEPVLLNPAVQASKLYLRLAGTGIRNAASLAATVGGVSVQTVIEEAQDGSAGMDFVQVGPLPATLAQRQLVDIELVADGFRSNSVQVAFSPSAGAAVTFSNQIVRLFQARCQTCHRPGEVAPFSLMDYESAKDWAALIKHETQTRRMPPWKAVEGFGDFLGSRRLSEAELDLIARWVDAGAPEGEPEDLPVPLEFNDDWEKGEPDLIVQAPDYVPDAGQSDDYRCFSVPVPADFAERKSIVTVEVQPGNRRIVHHVILYGDPKGESEALEAADTSPQPGYECYGDSGVSFNGFFLPVDSYFLALWAPGARAQVLPEGSGYVLRPGARMVVQVHYHPDGSETPDNTRIGLHFAEEPTPRNAIVVPALNTSFVIPPGEERYEVRATLNLRALGVVGALGAFLERAGVFPVQIRAVAPHMHMLGREISAQKVSATGEVTPLVRIDDWDFDWQSMYSYVDPIPFHISDQIEVLAVYDNSASNPNNPNDPPVAVGWGDRTTDEMCIVFFLVDLTDLCFLGGC